MKGRISGMRVRGLFAVMAVSLALAAVLGVARAGEAGTPGDRIKVGLLISFSGPGGLFGPPSRNAAQLAIEEINKRGGVLGRQLQLVIGDDQTDPRIGNQEMNRLVNREQVDVVVGMHSSATREAVKSIPARANKPYIYTPVYEGTDCGENMYFLSEVPNQQLATTIPFIMRLTKGKTWYLIGNDYVWPRTEVAFARSVIRKSGGRVVGQEFVPLGTSDFSTAVSKIRRARPALIFAPLVGADAVGFVKAAHDFGIRARYLTPLMEENTLLGIGGQAGAGIYTALSYFYNLNTPNNRKFKAAYVKRFGKKAPPQTSLSESVYEAINLFALGARKAGSVDTDELIEGMAGLTFNGPRGLVRLDGRNRHMSQHMYLAAAQPNAQYKVIKDFGVIKPSVKCRS
jgi:urea transport system substrate-binding protein